MSRAPHVDRPSERTLARRLRRRFWVEVALATASAVTLLLVLLEPQWIEVLTGLDPDSGSGALEWLMAAVTLAIALSSIALGRREWIKAQGAPA
jgi:hypothetical protein